MEIAPTPFSRGPRDRALPIATPAPAPSSRNPPPPFSPWHPRPGRSRPTRRPACPPATGPSTPPHTPWPSAPCRWAAARSSALVAQAEDQEIAGRRVGRALERPQPAALVAQILERRHRQPADLLAAATAAADRASAPCCCLPSMPVIAMLAQLVAEVAELALQRLAGNPAPSCPWRF